MKNVILLLFALTEFSLGAHLSEEEDKSAAAVRVSADTCRISERADVVQHGVNFNYPLKTACSAVSCTVYRFANEYVDDTFRGHDKGDKCVCEAVGFDHVPTLLFTMPGPCVVGACWDRYATIMTIAKRSELRNPQDYLRSLNHWETTCGGDSDQVTDIKTIADVVDDLDANGDKGASEEITQMVGVIEPPPPPPVAPNYWATIRKGIGVIWKKRIRLPKDALCDKAPVLKKASCSLCNRYEDGRGKASMLIAGIAYSPCQYVPAQNKCFPAFWVERKNFIAETDCAEVEMEQAPAHAKAEADAKAKAEAGAKAAAEAEAAAEAAEAKVKATTDDKAEVAWLDVSTEKGCRCNERGRTFGGRLDKQGQKFTLSACKDECQTSSCKQLDYKAASGWCSTYPSTCVVDRKCDGSWTAMQPPKR